MRRRNPNAVKEDRREMGWFSREKRKSLSGIRDCDSDGGRVTEVASSVGGRLVAVLTSGLKKQLNDVVFSGMVELVLRTGVRSMCRACKVVWQVRAHDHVLVSCHARMVR